MKKIPVLLLLATGLLFCAPLRAENLPGQIHAAVAAGNLDSIQALIVNNPAITSEAVIGLLQEAKQNFAEHPQLAAQAITIAADHAANISVAAAPQVGNLVQSIINLVSPSSLTKATEQPIAQIMAAALTIAGTPNIVAAQPQLYADTATVASQVSANIPASVSASAGLGNNAANQTQLAQQPSLEPPALPPFTQKPSGE